MGRAYLSLGSNIDAQANLRSAVVALRARFGDLLLSNAYVFPAVGFDGAETVLVDGNDFYAAPRLSPDGRRWSTAPRLSGL